MKICCYKIPSMLAESQTSSVPAYVSIDVIIDTIDRSNDLSEDQKSSIISSVAAAAINEASAKPLSPNRFLSSIGETTGVSSDPEKIIEEMNETVDEVGRLEKAHKINPGTNILSSRIRYIRNQIDELQKKAEESYDQATVEAVLDEVMREFGIKSLNLHQRIYVGIALRKVLGNDFGHINFG